MEFRFNEGEEAFRQEVESFPFSGQVAGLITDIKPAVQILEEMVEEAVDVLTRRLPESVIAK